MSRPGRLFNRQELLRAIWGDSAYRDPRAIDVHIRHLREKLEAAPEEPQPDPHRPRRGLPLPASREPCAAFGLRPRLLAALLVTSARDAGAAALALLPPLQHRSQEPACATTSARHARRRRSLAARPPSAKRARADCLRAIDSLHPRCAGTDARVSIYDIVPRAGLPTPTTGDARDLGVATALNAAHRADDRPLDDGRRRRRRSRCRCATASAPATTACSSRASR